MKRSTQFRRSYAPFTLTAWLRRYKKVGKDNSEKRKEGDGNKLRSRNATVRNMQAARRHPITNVRICIIEVTMGCFGMNACLRGSVVKRPILLELTMESASEPGR